MLLLPLHHRKTNTLLITPFDRNLIMILRRELKEAFCRSLLHPSSEHYIHGEFTHFLETRRLWPCVVI
uniref:Uncharacterized protein n=1 Tax=Lepeophtheirus salmonis TaxID=72036 RepID=A0A0K2T4Q8_LEPSM